MKKIGTNNKDNGRPAEIKSVMKITVNYKKSENHLIEDIY